MYLIQGKYMDAIERCHKELNGDYFEFEFLYAAETERFREIDRFLYESRHTLRFENEYEGNVVIDISNWCKKQNSYFDAFMYFLKDNADKYNCIFICNRKCPKDIIDIMSELFELEEICLNLPEDAKKERIGFAVNEEMRNTDVRS